MNNTAAALLRPGEAIFNIVLTLFGIDPNYFDAALHLIFSGLIALCFWSVVLRVVFTFVGRSLGFYPGRRY